MGGQTLVKNYLHIVFSTKNRINLIDDAIEEELFRYLGGISNKLNCQNLKVGGYKNHVHLLSMLNKNVSLSRLLEEVKSHSSLWIKTKGEKYRNFYWQNGYGAFSVKPSEVQKVIEYIANQKKHHSHLTFENEFRNHMRENEIEFNEKYVWD